MSQLSTEKPTTGLRLMPSPRTATVAATIVLIAALAGVILSAYLVHHKLNILYDPSYVSGCNINQSINCDKVNTSEWSELFGLPISLYGVPLYGLMIWLAASALMVLRSRREDLLAAFLARSDFLVAASTAAVVACLLLAGYAFFVLHTMCLLCMGLYAISLTLIVASLAMVRWRFGAALLGTLRTIGSGHYVLLASLVIVVLWCAAALGAYQVARGLRADSARQQVSKQLTTLTEEPIVFHYDQVPQAAAAGQPGAVPAVAGQPVAAAPAAPVAAAPVAAGAVAPQAAPAQPGAIPVGVPGGRLTEEGYQFYVTPLDAQDYVYGNPNAAVTVVKYADFECAFCKYFAQSMKPIMEKYKDKVRFVMKHFPMNPSCNRFMAGYDKHPNACNAAKAAICAGKQGKFWEMHDKLYENAPALAPEDNRRAAEAVGLDLAAYDACLADPATLARIQSDVEIGGRASIQGTPRAYVQGRLLTGSNSTDGLEYYIQKALESPNLFLAAPQAAQAPAAVPAAGSAAAMVQANRADGAFFIDAFEAARTQDGKAVAIAGVLPAMVSFDEAKAACEAAGKRLCSEEEWVSACAGQPAVDDNTNGWFNDDAIEGNMYPYGAFYDPSACHDSADKAKAFPVKTGEKSACKTPSGVFDLSGNIGEWVTTRSGKPGLMGGPASGGSGNTCNRRSSTFGTGYRNQTTGFRCCADSAVPPLQVTEEQLNKVELARVGAKLPAFTSEAEGKPVSIDALTGKVVLVSFFASWCGPCKKEFPVLVELYQQYHDKGLEVIAVGVDNTASLSLDFAKQFNPPFPIVADEDSNLMGLYGVYSMPATFIADRTGVIRHKSDEFAFEVQIQKLREAVQALVSQQ